MAGNYNESEVRVSADENTQINGKNYIDVARSYYHSQQYSEGMQVIENIFEETLPVFNAVPKVVNIAAALAVGTPIEPSYEDGEWVETVVDKLALEQEKVFLTRDLILGKSVLVEVQNIDTSNGSEFPYVMSYYSSDMYDVVSRGSEIIYAKISAVILQMNEEEDGYDSVEVEKIFIKKENGTAISYILNGDEKLEEVTYKNGMLPLVEITTTYDMKQLFYSIDRHNELECFIRNIFYLAGEPILAGSGIDSVANREANLIEEDRYKKLKILYNRNPQSSIKLLEIQGSATRVMIEKQNALVRAIIKDYPEYSISDVLAGSNVSEETTRIRLTEILSRVSEVRRNVETGVNKLLGIIAFMEGKEVSKTYVTFGNLTDANLQALMVILKQALESDLISHESAMYQIRNLFIGENLDEEKKRMELEREEQPEVEQSVAVDEEPEEEVVVEEEE